MDARVVSPPRQNPEGAFQHKHSLAIQSLRMMHRWLIARCKAVAGLVWFGLPLDSHSHEAKAKANLQEAPDTYSHTSSTSISSRNYHSIRSNPSFDAIGGY